MTFVFSWGLVGVRVCAKWTRPLSHALEVHLQNVCRWSLSRVFFFAGTCGRRTDSRVGHRSYFECIHCFCNYIFTVKIYTWHTRTRMYIYIYTFVHIHYMHTDFWYVSFIFVRRDSWLRFRPEEDLFGRFNEFQAKYWVSGLYTSQRTPNQLDTVVSGGLFGQGG